jgi:hypothetical protein
MLRLVVIGFGLLCVIALIAAVVVLVVGPALLPALQQFIDTFGLM